MIKSENPIAPTKIIESKWQDNMRRFARSRILSFFHEHLFHLFLGEGEDRKIYFIF
jgi:hypothetical protein